MVSGPLNGEHPFGTFGTCARTLVPTEKGPL